MTDEADRAGSRTAIAGLLGAYCTSYDGGDAAVLATLFADDARFHGLGIDVSGSANITAQLVPVDRASGRRTHHIVAEPEITFHDDDQAQATTRFAVVIASDAGPLFGAGAYVDAVIRSPRNGAAWQFTDRAVSLDVPLTAIDVDNPGGSR